MARETTRQSREDRMNYRERLLAETTELIRSKQHHATKSWQDKLISLKVGCEIKRRDREEVKEDIALGRDRQNY